MKAIERLKNCCILAEYYITDCQMCGTEIICVAIAPDFHAIAICSSCLKELAKEMDEIKP